MGNVLKLVGGVPSGKLNWPPNNCIPSSAKIRINKNSRNNKEMIERIEFKRDITRLRREDQYLLNKHIFTFNNSTYLSKENNNNVLILFFFILIIIFIHSGSYCVFG